MCIQPEFFISVVFLFCGTVSALTLFNTHPSTSEDRVGIPLTLQPLINCLSFALAALGSQTSTKIDEHMELLPLFLQSPEHIFATITH